MMPVMFGYLFRYKNFVFHNQMNDRVILLMLNVILFLNIVRRTYKVHYLNEMSELCGQCTVKSVYENQRFLILASPGSFLTDS